MKMRVVILGTADWNQPIATNQHYIARELSKEFDVVFVESMGLRRPEISWRDAKRIWHRLRKLLHSKPEPQRNSGRDQGNIQVISPFVLPFHGRIAAAVNSRLVRRLGTSIGLGNRDDTLLWTFTPVTYGREDQAIATVYHCVDLLGEVEGISRRIIDRHERALADRASTSIATSPKVLAHLRNNGFEPQLWPNVADVAVIEAARRVSGERIPNRVIFAGNLSARKVDFRLLNLLVERGADLHLAGPISEGGGSSRAQVQGLVSKGATYHGTLALEDLAALYWTGSCGLIPYQSNTYTSGVSPLKTYEYLAAGLSVVSIGVPSVQPIDGHVTTAGTPEDFLNAVCASAITPSQDAVTHRSALAELNSWDRRGRDARDLARSLCTFQQEVR